MGQENGKRRFGKRRKETSIENKLANSLILGLKNLSRKELEQLNRRKKQENVEELEKLKKRRVERENAREERENEQYQHQRSKEAAQFAEWQKQEETFHLEQARLRSKIRIQDGRAKPIDLLGEFSKLILSRSSIVP